MQKLLVSFFFVCTLFSSLFSEQKKEKPDIEEKIEVIGKMPLFRAMQSVSVLDYEHIRNFSPDGLKDLLNQSPGILVLNAGNPAQFSYSFARGASVNQMLYLVDGIKLHDPSSSLAGNFSFFSPQLIEKIEIVRGPLSNLYGSSAMGGVVNIITRKKEGLAFSLSGGSHGTLDSSIQYGQRFGEFFICLNGDFLNYDDGLANDHFERRGFSFNSAYGNDVLNIGVSAFGTIADAGIPHYLGNPTPERSYKQNNFIIYTPINWQINKRSDFDFKGSLHWNNYEFFDPEDTWNYFYSNASFLKEIQAKFLSNFMDKMNLAVGFDFSEQEIENKNNDENLLSELKTNVFSLFLDLNADLNKFLLSGSIRFDKYKDLEGVFSPQFGVSFNLNSFLKLRSSFSKSFRAPTLPEMLNPNWGNPLLLPETGSSYEIGADAFFSSIVLGITCFNSNYKNLIGFSPLTARFANISEAKISGIEVNWDWKICEGLDWRTAYTYLHTQDIQYDRALLRRPRHALTASFLVHNAKFVLSAEMTYVGKRLDYDELLWSVSENNPFNHFDFVLQIPIFKNLNIFCRVNNAFNSYFEEVLGYPAPLRRVLLGFKYQGAN
jgi:vitamin B12 transporter